MPYVTSVFARRVVQAAPSVDGSALLRSVGIDPDAPFDVAEMIPAEDYFGLLERVAEAMEDAHELPVRVGPLMRPEDYGALGLAWKSAPTVRQSLERVARYARVWTGNMAYELRDHEEGARFLLHRDVERSLGVRLSNEATVASATSLIRQTSGADFQPRAVYFRHPAPRITGAHEGYFGCRVHFGADMDALSISTEDLERPNHLGDDGISAYLLSHLDREIESLGSGDSLEESVRRAISQALSEGVPKMRDVARRLAMSERTLHRRLADRGRSFKTVLDATRRELAENLLRQSEYTLSEVAFLTGFSDQSSFQRAFKRWTGTTPATHRGRSGVSR